MRCASSRILNNDYGQILKLFKWRACGFMPKTVYFWVMLKLNIIIHLESATKNSRHIYGIGTRALRNTNMSSLSLHLSLLPILSLKSHFTLSSSLIFHLRLHIEANNKKKIECISREYYANFTTKLFLVSKPK